MAHVHFCLFELFKNPCPKTLARSFWAVLKCFLSQIFSVKVLFLIYKVLRYAKDDSPSSCRYTGVACLAIVNCLLAIVRLMKVFTSILTASFASQVKPRLRSSSLYFLSYS